MSGPDPRRSLPAVGRLIEDPAFGRLRERIPRSRLVHLVRASLDRARTGAPSALPTGPEEWAADVEALLRRQEARAPRPLLNGTGVVIHTNLGRAPLSKAARERMGHVATAYSNLEYDIESGERGSRTALLEDQWRRLTGTEAALVVNNAAGALVLALAAVARGRPVAVSRGELIEIGGGFRIPEVVATAGTPLLEVGTTNRTRLEDYERAVRRGRVGALLKVHRSNFRMSGFTESVDIGTLADLGRRYGVPVVHDLGTGAMVDLAVVGLPSEPTVQESVGAGAALVVFSGDKLLGGPQAGVLLGWAEAVRAAALHPLARALRADKTTLAALAATLDAYERETAWRELPVLAMLAADVGGLERRAAAMAEALSGAGAASVVEVESVVGGGSLPGARLPSRGLRLEGGGELAQRLREGDPAVIGRVEAGHVLLDLRTIPPSLDELVVGAVSAALGRKSD